MKLRRPSLLLMVTVLFLSVGCGQKLRNVLRPNQAPSVRFLPTRVLVDRPEGRTYSVSWQGEDVDGQVDHFMVALDPASSDPEGPGWLSTAESSRRVTLADSSHGVTTHRFVVCAIDDRGARSTPIMISLGADNMPPEVHITCPVPSHSYIPVPMGVRIEWVGTDPDGSTGKPALYKYILLSPSSEFPEQLAHSHPDSLRNYYAHHPAGPWAGWDSTSAESTHVVLKNLTYRTPYTFVVVAFDEAGDYSQTFDLDTNVLGLNSLSSELVGPQFKLQGDSFEFEYPGGGYVDTPARHVRHEFAAGASIPIRWSTQRDYGECAPIRYRWVLDPESLDDPTPRSDEADVHHWSAWGSSTSATLGPFVSSHPPKRDVHTLYIAADDGIASSLAILDLIIVPHQFTKDLLFVNDTRLRRDFMVGGVLQPPSGQWPTAAELDTFLFARGGVEWRGYPAGTMSPTGVFNGYSYDTLGTWGLRTGIPLSTLAQYRYVVWCVDGVGGQSKGALSDPTQPMSVLRFMGLPGNTNTLAAYVRLGGMLWLAGGGAGNAASDGFNDVANDRLPVNLTKTYSHFSSTKNELGPGRFMYDVVKWQSEFRIFHPPLHVEKALGRFTNTGVYPGLPDRLEAKTPDTDPLEIEAPTRGPEDFYLAAADIEFLQKPNAIGEADGTLDTLYRVYASTLPDTEPDPARSPAYPIMTWCHGPTAIDGSVVHTGFPFWFFRRSQCTQLVDFVLHDLWGLSRAGGPSAQTRRQTPSPPRLTSKRPGTPWRGSASKN